MPLSKPRAAAVWELCLIRLPEQDGSPSAADASTVAGQVPERWAWTFARLTAEVARLAAP